MIYQILYLEIFPLCLFFGQCGFEVNVSEFSFCFFQPGGAPIKLVLKVMPLDGAFLKVFTCLKNVNEDKKLSITDIFITIYYKMFR